MAEHEENIHLNCNGLGGEMQFFLPKGFPVWEICMWWYMVFTASCFITFLYYKVWVMSILFHLL